MMYVLGLEGASRRIKDTPATREALFNKKKKKKRRSEWDGTFGSHAGCC